MFIKAQSKQRFGAIREPYINIAQIVTADVAHDGSSVAVKLANNEEMLVTGEHAQKLREYLEQQQVGK